MKRIISIGAEAVIFKEGAKVVKHRISKKYRLKEIDNVLRKKRTRREAKVLDKIPVLAPKLISFDDKDMKIEMSFVKGDKLRDVFEVKHARKVGEMVGLIHNKGIIHGDLTTSNMIIKKGVIYFIDFGLSFFSDKVEDKAVDIHLFRQALESKHHKIYKKSYDMFLKSYKRTCKNSKDVLERLKVVEGRGRYKGKSS